MSKRYSCYVCSFKQLSLIIAFAVSRGCVVTNKLKSAKSADISVTLATGDNTRSSFLRFETTIDKQVTTTVVTVPELLQVIGKIRPRNKVQLISPSSTKVGKYTFMYNDHNHALKAEKIEQLYAMLVGLQPAIQHTGPVKIFYTRSYNSAIAEGLCNIAIGHGYRRDNRIIDYEPSENDEEIRLFIFEPSKARFSDGCFSDRWANGNFDLMSFENVVETLSKPQLLISGEAVSVEPFQSIKIGCLTIPALEALELYYTLKANS